MNVFFHRLLQRAIGYSSVGVSTFVLDLSIVALLHFQFGVAYPLAIAIGFLIGISVNYVVCYHVIYKGTERRFILGLLFFAGVAVFGALFIMYTVAALVTYLHVPLLIARILVGACIGTVNFLINTFFNFKML